MNEILTVTDIKLQRGAHFNLSVPNIRMKPGAILCLTGPNGSGKTTFIHCLAGLLAVDSGTIYVDGVAVSNNLQVTKAMIGFIPDDEEWLIKELCAQEYFELLLGIYKQAGVTIDMGKRIAELGRLLSFTALLQPISSLSHGNKKKVQLIAGLMHKPALIIVDEVRNGLDPLAIIATERLLEQEAKQGAAIIAATHDLPWAERIATEVLLLIDGNVYLHEKKHNLAKRGGLERLFLEAMDRG